MTPRSLVSMPNPSGKKDKDQAVSSSFRRLGSFCRQQKTESKKGGGGGGSERGDRPPPRLDSSSRHRCLRRGEIEYIIQLLNRGELAFKIARFCGVCLLGSD
ncbi:hypothetical protein GRJ2_001030000 [Grus japonensis]|uniref:Uncharacterized protein n=1 Tax=Grus japonensis TaxID=30415 RepID=A0ABC9WMR0_GRUJA